MPEAVVEHVGSTAIPECDGKGYIDLMLIYPEGKLERAKRVLDEELGFQRQVKGTFIFPETRPLRLGALEYGGKRYLIHVHVLAHDSPEVAAQRAFRDRLRAHPDLVQAYVAEKCRVLLTGVEESVDYSVAKSPFVERVIADALTP